MTDSAVHIHDNKVPHASGVPDPDVWPEDPAEWREEFRRRMAARGVHVRLPHPDATWTPPEHPLPISADELSRFVVELRRTGKL